MWLNVIYTFTLTLVPFSIFSGASQKMSSEYILINRNDKMQPCLAPRLIEISSESSSSIYINAV